MEENVDKKNGFPQEKIDKCFATGIHKGKLVLNTLVFKSYPRLWMALMLEVISRMVAEVSGSDFRRSSTLRMEERTVE